jgi:dTDP-4-amino-4,6-dideoxygalactose transaminase
MNLQMVDLRGQYLRIRDDVDAAMQAVVDTTAFIRGPAVGAFEQALAEYLGARFVHGVANGTDALQVALMALGVGRGDEVITPSFTFVATAEAAALLGAVPVFADIDPRSFNIDPAAVEALVTPRTRAIVPVHLFGQPAAMDAILDIGRRHGIPVIEDNAQGIGSTWRGRMTGTIGTIGTLSFFPSKNLGCYGDGGAVITMDEELYERMKLIANHGSTRKYRNERVGVNSRLDTLQAAVLQAKLPHLDRFTADRREAADRYDAALGGLPGIEIPWRDPDGVHVFHQYTIRVTSGGGSDGGAARDALAARLKEARIPHAVYYPVPLHRLPVFAPGGEAECRHDDMVHTDRAADEVLSLPMHTELTPEQIATITEAVGAFAGERAEAGA